MSELMVKDKLIDPVAGLVVVEDVTAGDTVSLRVVSDDRVLTRSIHYVRSFERVPRHNPLVVTAYVAILTTVIVAAGVILL